MSFSIGVFHKVHYKEMLKKYAYHRILLCLLGKHEWKSIINEAFLEENNAVITERDYDESLKAEFDMET